MAATIEILVKDVNDVEAHVLAEFVDSTGVDAGSLESDPVKLNGTLRGPYCETAQTLPAEFLFRDLGPRQPGCAEVVVPDPCIWTPELPHYYRADIEARRDGRVVAEYHGMIGLQRASSK